MSERVFIDTNVLLYADDPAAAARVKRTRARSVLAQLFRTRQAVISTQVMQEYFAAATRKLQLPAEAARRRLEALQHLDVVVIRPDLILGAIDLHRLNAISFWDALIVKSARASGCAVVVTEDLNHGQMIDGVRIDNPFVQTSRSAEPSVRYHVRPRKRPPRPRSRAAAK